MIKVVLYNIVVVVLSRFNVWIKENTKYAVVLGPFGAFITLQYALTMAPPSQPRNALLGQIVSLSIAHVIKIIPFLAIWIKQALAPSISIGAMALLGIVHPPAGASALVFVSGEYSFGTVCVTLFANMIAIGIAVLFNNTNEKRQYPTQWGFVQTWRQLESFFPKSKSKK